MTANKHATATDLERLDAHVVQPEELEDIPELGDDFFEKAEYRIGTKVVRRGRPPLETPKRLVTLRLDQDVVERFRATGRGWQSRINAALRKHLENVS